jgi:hypothetical protein
MNDLSLYFEMFELCSDTILISIFVFSTEVAFGVSLRDVTALPSGRHSYAEPTAEV